MPPLPGSANPEIASASTMSVSKMPSTITISVESSIPREAVTATSKIRNSMNHHHLKVQPYAAFSVDWSVSPINEPACATTTG
jgi:hypothetical protein